MSAARSNPLAGRTCYVPWMGSGTTRLFCAALRGAGIDARPVPESDAQTLELSAPYVSEQCYPQRVTLGNFLKIVATPGFNPSSVAFFMPQASGPCRFGQYAAFTRQVLAERGAGEVLLLSPGFDDGYAALGANGTLAMRYGWWGLAAADVLRRLLHRLRPYEREVGATDRVYAESLAVLEAILSDRHDRCRAKFTVLQRTLAAIRDRFRAVDVDRSVERPVIGVVGEIFCRLDCFSNEDIVRRIEDHGGEAWLAGLCEWVHYANHWEQVELKAAGGRSLRRLRSWLSDRIQHRDEHLITAPFANDLAGRREPSTVAEILSLAHPYLPAAAGLGEMTLSLGRAIYLQQQGVAGVLDISPFTCMNGIVSEAIYPKLSREHCNIPIRTLYFDGTHAVTEQQLELFMELVCSRRAVTSR